MKKFSIFEYLYRDASNYKVWGSLVLQGDCKSSDLKILHSKFDRGSYFIAEQLRVPPLYAELWQYSDGITSDDHAWHEFSSLRPATEKDTTTPVFSSVKDFINSIDLIAYWRPAASPNWAVTPTEK